MLLVFVLSTCVLYLHVPIVFCQISWKFCRNTSCWNTSTIFRKRVYFHRKNYGIRKLQWNGRWKYLKSRKLTNDDSIKTLILCNTNVYKTLLVHIGRELFLYMLCRNDTNLALRFISNDRSKFFIQLKYPKSERFNINYITYIHCTMYL